jgi:glycolate oxidase iron-sulfur subunit
MQTQLPADFIATDRGRRANEILRSCWHCVFVMPPVPPINSVGMSWDGPRGRIYLIKELFERRLKIRTRSPTLGSLSDLPGLRNYRSVPALLTVS